MELLTTVKSRFNYLSFLAQLVREKVFRLSTPSPEGEPIMNTSLFLDGDVLVEVFRDQTGRLLIEEYPNLAYRHTQTIREKVNTLKTLDKHITIASNILFIFSYVGFLFLQFQLTQTSDWDLIWKLLWSLFGSSLLSFLFRLIVKRVLIYIIKHFLQ